MSESCYSGLLLSLNRQLTKVRDFHFDTGPMCHLRLAAFGRRQLIQLSIPIALDSIAKRDLFFAVHSKE